MSIRRSVRTATRRAAIVAGLIAPVQALTPAQQQGQSAAPDDSFRYRWMTLNELYRRARHARVQQTISYSAYTAIVTLLREEEISIFAAAAKHRFTDLTESNYWHRSQLKFPSSLATEQRLLSEGSDPALPSR